MAETRRLRWISGHSLIPIAYKGQCFPIFLESGRYSGQVSRVAERFLASKALQVHRKGHIMRVMFRLSIFLSLIIGSLSFIQNPIFANEESHNKRMGGAGRTPQDLAMLPPACLAKFNGTLEEKRMWAKALGDAYTHLHHYCGGLIALNRISRGLGDRDYLLDNALYQFGYMQKFLSENNPLRSEVEYNAGFTLYEMKRIPAALVPLRKAIQLKPDYVSAYLLLSRCYQQLGKSTSAAEILRAGLAKVPASQALQSALDEVSSNQQKSSQDKH
jgi:tetratricopeptide (TPR) repeat protein